MSKSPAEKLAQKRSAWLARTSRILGVDETAALVLLNQKRQQGIRINPLVADPAKTYATLQQKGWCGEPYLWAEHCCHIAGDQTALRDSELVASGTLYIQNAASWLPVVALDPQPGQDILDVCAAPGGKASHIAALTQNKAELTVNDNSRARLAKMKANLERLGVNAEYTLYDASRLAQKLAGNQFDAILLDAPCSGEGLMQYDRDKDFATWSVAHIQRLQSLQKQIVLQAWQLLRPGGTLVYSTCTMAPEENEAVIDYLLRKRSDAAVQPLHFDLPNQVTCVSGWNGKEYNAAVKRAIRLTPSKNIEAFFVCKLQKLADPIETML
jgi:NOL1/NOP2/sun family putative RNA methylase